ncbi:helix-turn-helix domain-containing protein [Streptomyces sp. NPDC004279]
MTVPSPGPATERADAARNRARLLEAAARLVAESGAGQVTMQAVAEAAGVGKGTLFRRFGDRDGLLLALLDEAEEAFQEAYTSGPPSPAGTGSVRGRPAGGLRLRPARPRHMHHGPGHGAGTPRGLRTP